MFIACPHCRYLVATDPRTQAAPQRCTRCGRPLGGEADAVAAPATGPQSLATLLRRDEPAPAPAAPIIANSDGDDLAADPTPAATSHPLTTADNAAAADELAQVQTAIEANPATVETTAQATSDGVPHSEGAAANAHDDQTQAVDSAASPSVDEDQSAQPSVAAPTAASSTTVAPAAATRRSGARAPAFLRGGERTRAPAHRAMRWQVIAVIVLALSLLVQMLLADRARLAGDASWRPLIVGLCNVLGCSVPPWREPQAFVMLDRDVRPLPGVAGVLQARATFRNEARWAQPWPTLVLTLQDADGRQLGARALGPADYLRGQAANQELAPGQSAQVAVNIREPSADVVAFSFDFR